MRFLKKFLKWTGLTLLLVLVVATVAVIAKHDRTFEAPYPKITASSDPVIIEKGKNIVYGPAHCASCHAPVEKAAEIERGELVELSGGHLFDIPPGKIYTPNITSCKETGIGNLADSVIARSLRYGVGFDGRALPDFMPFHNMSDEDLTAVISYLRSVEPVKNKVPQTDFNVLGNILKAFVIEPVGPDIEIPVKVIPAETPEYGKYLSESVANCRGCHTNRDMKTGAFIGPFYGGGFQMESEINKGVIVVTPNITFDSETGRLAGWSEQDFINRFRKGKVITDSPMPWGPFSRMTDTDLKAIYSYLRMIPPVNNDPGPVMFVNAE